MIFGVFGVKTDLFFRTKKLIPKLFRTKFLISNFRRKIKHFSQTKSKLLQTKKPKPTKNYRAHKPLSAGSTSECPTTGRPPPCTVLCRKGPRDVWTEDSRKQVRMQATKHKSRIENWSKLKEAKGRPLQTLKNCFFA
jgi:hypothetical protein